MPSPRPHPAHAAATLVCLALTLTAAPVARAQDIPWRPGPATAPIGDDLAEIDLSGDYLWLNAGDTRDLMEWMENPVTGTEMATVTSTAEDEMWYLLFEWDEIGYVEDDEGDELDAKAMLSSIRQGNAQANRERERRGWAPLKIIGWQEPPHYDSQTHNLTWAIIGESEGQRVVNRNIRILGRRGVMSLTLVSPPEELAAASARVDRLLEGYRFRPGNRYAEYVPGSDRAAEIGLTALVVGGAGAMAVKSGLLARFWKFLVAGFVALLAGLKRMFRRRAADTSLRGMERQGLS